MRKRNDKLKKTECNSTQEDEILAVEIDFFKFKMLMIMVCRGSNHEKADALFDILTYKTR